MSGAAVYTLTSPLHDRESVETVSSSFLASLERLAGYRLEVKGPDFSGYGSSPLSLVYVRTGGTEGIFMDLYSRYGELFRSSPVRLLASGESNSLAAAMEILSFLMQQGCRGEIIHGPAASVARRISMLMKVEDAYAGLEGRRYGIIGKPSDWLIASPAGSRAAESALGVTLVEIGMDELVSEIRRKEYPEPAAGLLKPGNLQLEGALYIYGALRRTAEKYGLSGFTLRCFDLLGAVGNTGCLALSLLNSEGMVAGCEGDVPAMLTMAISRALTGSSGFQANPARVDAGKGDIVFAHCTIPLDMLKDYSYDTHFESGIGVAVCGEMEKGDLTVFKVSHDLSRYFVCEASLVENLHEKSLCRTQLYLHTESDLSYFLTDPIGNHHVIMKGRCSALVSAFMDRLSSGTPARTSETPA